MFKKLQKLNISPNDIKDAKDLTRVINTIQTNIQDSINPMVAKTQNDSLILTNVSLTAGQVNTVNHTLGRKLSGWPIIRLRSQAVVWDSQDTNKSPSLTLLLNCSADCIVDILVF